jgi:hypothetical protein
MRVEAYRARHKKLWDDFVRASKNGTFLLFRDYMEYHAARFKDHSLLIWDAKDNLSAVLPANLDQDTLVSHGGLTFGGFITQASMKLPQMLELFEATLAYIKQGGCNRLIYKAVPHIYHRFPAEEDQYALFRCNARLIRCGVLAVIGSDHRMPFQERRNRGIKKAIQNGLTVSQTTDFASYWKILEERLQTAHNTKPVHTLAEIQLLKSRFPDNIKLFGCFKGTDMLAGVVIYESSQVAHVQYVAASDLGLELSALDLVFGDLVHNQYRAKPHFDFGTSDEKVGNYLNRGLIDQKEGFGARAVASNQYEVDLAGWKPYALDREPTSSRPSARDGISHS